MSVIRLPLVVDDRRDRHRVERLFSAMWQIKQAVQRDARAAVEAYWAGEVRREADPKGWRAELGLSRDGLERRAYRHLEASRWLGHHVTKALVMHQADEVWAGVSRHLFGDASGKRAGRPRPGSWWDYTRIPGRARSHTTARKWETFRLAGTLQGHLDAYRAPGLPADLTAGTGSVNSGAVRSAVRLEAGTSVLAQPRHLRRPAAPVHRTSSRASSWWDHTGPLVVVFPGGTASAAGDLVLPVRLPQGAGRWPYLAHYLADPTIWHKIDLVRCRDASAPGGWRYEAHLMVLGPGYASPATTARRTAAAGLDRVGGVDGNVSNLAVVSLPVTFDPADGPIRSTRLALTDAEQAALARRQRQAKGRARALDRSRRATNPGQYQPSTAQARRSQRRARAGLPARQIGTPGGARIANARGIPRQAYRKDTLSSGYRMLRARHAMAAASAAQASKQRAIRLAADLTTTHGGRLTVEDCDISTWFRLWGKTCSATTPGRLITALDRECAAIGGGRLLRASTFTTALSQHCLCGARVPKSLRERIHFCPDCGLTCDRDLLSAALAAHTTLTDPDDPATAHLDQTQTRHTQTLFPGLQEALSESTVHMSTPSGRTGTAAHPRPARRNRRAKRRASARRSAGTCGVPTPDETRPATAVQGPHRNDTHATRTVPELRDSS